MSHNTYINPSIRRKLFKEIKRMEARTNTKSKQEVWRGIVAVLNQHNNLMDIESARSEEGAKISEYYREHGGEELKPKTLDEWRESDDIAEPVNPTSEAKKRHDIALDVLRCTAKAARDSHHQKMLDDMVSRGLIDPKSDPLENFIDRHFKVIAAVILLTLVGFSWFIGA